MSDERSPPSLRELDIAAREADHIAEFWFREIALAKNPDERARALKKNEHWRNRAKRLRAQSSAKGSANE